MFHNTLNERNYLAQLEYIVNCGQKRDDRTGTGTIGVFGTQSRYNLREDFPLLTTKKMYWKGIVHELIWMLNGDTNISYLRQNGVHIWDDDAYRFFKQCWDPLVKGEPCPSKEKFLELVDQDPKNFGHLGPVYGQQWRNWENSVIAPFYGGDQDEVTIDQIHRVIQDLKYNPCSRRHIVTAWNPSDLQFMALPPCHLLFQFYVCNGELSCQMYQRSADMFLGVPFNIASYSLLTHIVAKECNLKPGEFIHTIGDAHIYLNHIDQVREQLSRAPLDPPQLEIDSTKWKGINDLSFDTFLLKNYQSHSQIKGKLST